MTTFHPRRLILNVVAFFIYSIYLLPKAVTIHNHKIGKIAKHVF